jgi:hypothetical protein
MFREKKSFIKLTPGTTIEKKRIFVHPEYNGKSAYFDIAIVETESLTFSDFIQPIW